MQRASPLSRQCCLRVLPRFEQDDAAALRRAATSLTVNQRVLIVERVQQGVSPAKKACQFKLAGFDGFGDYAGS
jgi:hypothetical protein